MHSKNTYISFFYYHCFSLLYFIIYSTFIAVNYFFLHFHCFVDACVVLTILLLLMVFEWMQELHISRINFGCCEYLVSCI